MPRYGGKFVKSLKSQHFECWLKGRLLLLYAIDLTQNTSQTATRVLWMINSGKLNSLVIIVTNFKAESRRNPGDSATLKQVNSRHQTKNRRQWIIKDGKRKWTFFVNTSRLYHSNRLERANPWKALISRDFREIRMNSYVKFYVWFICLLPPLASWSFFHSNKEQQNVKVFESHRISVRNTNFHGVTRFPLWFQTMSLFWKIS